MNILLGIVNSRKIFFISEWELTIALKLVCEFSVNDGIKNSMPKLALFNTFAKNKFWDKILFFCIFDFIWN